MIANTVHLLIQIHTHTHTQPPNKCVAWMYVHAQWDDKRNWSGQEVVGGWWWWCWCKQAIQNEKRKISHVPHQVNHFEFQWICKECVFTWKCFHVMCFPTSTLSKLGRCSITHLVASFLVVLPFQWDDCASKFQWFRDERCKLSNSLKGDKKKWQNNWINRAAAN